jgi:CARDB
MKTTWWIPLVSVLVTTTAQAAPAPSRPLQIHGPFFIDAAALSTTLHTPVVPILQPNTNPPDNCAIHNCGSGAQPRSPVAKPNVTGSTEHPLDPGIAVSNSYVLLQDSKDITVYDKAGELVLAKRGAFPNPFTMASLFDPIRADINAHMHYPQLDPAVDTKIEGDGDARVLFDPFRKRFIISSVLQNTGIAINILNSACIVPAGKTIDTSGCSASQKAVYHQIKSDHNLLISWRQKVVVAVSLTEDVRDGFNLYWWDAVIDNDGCTSLNGCAGESVFTPGTSNVDYPETAISEHYFLVTVAEGLVDTNPHDAPKINSDFDAWWRCFHADTDGGDYKKRLYADLMIIPADALANPPCAGSPYSTPGTSPFSTARSFALFLDDPESGIDGSQHRIVRPVFHHTHVAGDAVFFENPHVEATRSFLALHTVSFATAVPELTTTKVPVMTIDSPSELGGSAAFRDGKLYATWQELFLWPGASNSLQSIHVVTLNPLAAHPAQGAAFSENRLGLRSTLEDPASVERQYEFPAIDVNKRGDLAVLYARFASDLGQEVRFQVKMHGSIEFDASRLMRAGERLASGGTDTAGAATDPFDDVSIWMAQYYADAVNYRAAFGRVFGSAHGDLSVSQLSFTAPPGLHPGDALHVTGVVHNGGDGRAGSFRVTIRVSSDTVITPSDAQAGDLDVQGLASGADKAFDVIMHVPASIAPGDYFVGARVRMTDGNDEYSTANNASPVIASDPRIHVVRAGSPLPQ